MKENEKKQLVYKHLNELKLNEKNPRKNDMAVDAVAKSIEQYGFKNPLIIDKDGVVYCGNTRLKAAKKLGLDEVPCIVADDLTKKQIREYALLDNKTNELAEWDMTLLADELAELDLDSFGLDWGVGEEIDQEPQEDDYNVDDALEKVEAKAKLGEVYQLGEHRLMCGDSTNMGDVLALMNGQDADMVFTDPPYNIDYDKNKNGKIANDNMDDTSFEHFMTDTFATMNEVLKQGGAFYIFHSPLHVKEVERALNNNNFEVREQLIWNKNTFTLCRQDYQWKHEPCLYGWKDGAAHYFIDDRTQSTVIEDKKQDFAKMKKDELVRLLENIYSDKVSTTIIDEKKPSVNDLHPTMKPITLCARLVKNSSRIGENVLDLFGGSGSTLMACEQIGRKCYTMELDPHYCDVIIDRWEQFTGKKAKKIK